MELFGLYLYPPIVISSALEARVGAYMYMHFINELGVDWTCILTTPFKVVFWSLFRRTTLNLLFDSNPQAFIFEETPPLIDGITMLGKSLPPRIVKIIP